MKRIHIEGVDLEVAHHPGDPDRAPLVFLHEGLGSVAMWPQRGRNWPRELCARTGRAGWLYSRRGYGQSDPVPDVRGHPRQEGFWHVGRHEVDYMQREAHDVLPRLLQALNISCPVLIGHSDGGTIALLHAARHQVQACIVMAPHVMVEDMSIAAIEQARQQYLDTRHPGHLRERLMRFHRDVDNAFWQWNDIWLSDGFRSFDIRPDCAHIQAPVLAIQGTDDAYGSLRQLHDIQAQLPSAELATFEQCGHSPHRDQPDRLTDTVASFLKRQES
ncbi:MAG: alpha/beta fold hydrolase [Gammaproteobacteria bacterium]